jgi:hypothetical protein
MNVRPLRRRTTPAIPVLAVAALLAVCCSGATAIAAVSSKPKPKVVHRASSLAGSWSGQYSGPVSGTFTLHWTQSGSSLTGSITLSSPPGKYGIDGHVNGSAISFGAVGAGATYTGSVRGTSMSGSWQSSIGGGNWSAHKTT